MCITRFEQDGSIVAVVAHVDIAGRTLAEETLRESEGEFRFFSKLGEANRALREPEQVLEVTARMLGRHLRASRLCGGRARRRSLFDPARTEEADDERSGDDRAERCEAGQEL
jgi:hypothetical protein